jgi:hypothetical protein
MRLERPADYTDKLKQLATIVPFQANQGEKGVGC